jgi:hypothetical protein
MPTANKTFSVKNGLDVANTIVLDSNRNLSNINIANIASTLNVAGNDLYGVINTVYTTANSKVYTFQQTTPPLTANADDQWVNSNSGIMYVNANTVNPAVWVEFGPVGTPVTNTFTTQYIAATTYAASNADFYIGMNCTSNSIVTLPLANNGTMIVVKDESGNAGVNCNVAVIPSDGDLIDGQNKVTININYGSLTFIYRNGWRII